MLKKRSKTNRERGPNKKPGAYIEKSKSEFEEKLEEAASDKKKKHLDNDSYEKLLIRVTIWSAISI